jgi:hypothetical protein
MERSNAPLEFLQQTDVRITYDHKLLKGVGHHVARNHGSLETAGCACEQLDRRTGDNEDIFAQLWQI